MRAQRTVDAASARHHASQPARQAAVLLTRSVRTQRLSSNFQETCADAAYLGGIFQLKEGAFEYRFIPGCQGR